MATTFFRSTPDCIRTNFKTFPTTGLLGLSSPSHRPHDFVSLELLYNPAMSGCTRLTIAQQQRLIAEFDNRRRNGERCDQRSLGEWPGRFFSFQKPLAQSTLSRIIKMRKTLEATLSTNCKSIRSPVSAKFDESVCICINDCACKHSALSDNIIKQKAERIWLMTQGGRTGPVLQFSNGWLEKFKKRHGCRRISYHGEQASAAILHAQNALPIIRIELGGYNVDEIYNADEFGLQYRLAPIKTIAATQVSRL